MRGWFVLEIKNVGGRKKRNEGREFSRSCKMEIMDG
jgi:hypothetical protein